MKAKLLSLLTIPILLLTSCSLTKTNTESSQISYGEKFYKFYGGVYNYDNYPDVTFDDEFYLIKGSFLSFTNKGIKSNCFYGSSEEIEKDNYVISGNVYISRRYSYYPNREPFYFDKIVIYGGQVACWDVYYDPWNGNYVDGDSSFRLITSLKFCTLEFAENSNMRIYE